MKKTISAILAILVLLATATTVSAYVDVGENAWYHNAINYVTERGLFSGTGNDRFEPKKPMTRGMFVTVLSRLDGADLEPYSSVHFLDVQNEAWYAKSVEWAAEHGITSGTARFTFAPDRPVTREQIAMFLYNYAKSAGEDMAIKPTSKQFVDYDTVSDWARTAVDWAISNSLLAGDDKRRINPRNTATRAEVAQIFSRYAQTFDKTIPNSSTSVLPEPDELDKVMYDMSDSELVGQMLVGRYSSDSVKLARDLHLGGFTLYARDFEGKTKLEVQAMTEVLQKNASLPLFIAVDEEGGTVNRVSLNKNLRAEPFRSMREIYETSGIEGIRKDTEEKSKLLKSLGINLNLAPVCDLSTNPDDYIYERTTGQDALTTAEIISTIVSTMDENGMYSALKHFPGYGNNKDTHTGVSIDKRPWTTFEQDDFLPFQAGIDSNATCVLVSHNVINCMDETKPASLSKPVHDVLRNTLGFEGLILTDDLGMDGIKPYSNNPAVDAVLAGNDVILTSSPERDHANLLKALKNGTIPRDTITAAVRRILAVKLK